MNRFKRTFKKYFTFLFVSFVILILFGCKPVKKITTTTKSSTETSDFYKKYSKTLGFELSGKEDKKFIEQISEWLGTPYVYGGESKKGTDCSGFVQTFYKDYKNISLNRTAADLVKNCETVQKKDLKIGDLIFFKINSAKVSHVGIYLGQDKFIHASSAKGVIVSGLSETYYTKYFFAGGRIKDLK